LPVDQGFANPTAASVARNGRPGEPFSGLRKSTDVLTLGRAYDIRRNRRGAQWRPEVGWIEMLMTTHRRFKRHLRLRSLYAMRKLRDAKRRLIVRGFFFRLRCRSRIIVWWRRIRAWFAVLLATFVGLLVAAAFWLFVPEAVLADPNFKTSEVHLAAAGIIGTALALVLTLSIIPAQKAADVFSSAILRLYASDKTTTTVFVGLAFLALISLLLGTSWTFHISPRHTVAFQFVILGAGLDALRVFYIRALKLLVPATALELVNNECNRYIDRTRREIERVVRVYQRNGLTVGDGGASISRWRIYAGLQMPRALAGWIDQLEEFAHKALARRDTQAARLVVNTMASIGLRYADARRDSLVLLPDFTGPMPTAFSDVENVLQPVYESLKNICDDAVTQPSEAIVMACIHALANMAVHAMTIVHNEEHRCSAPLAHAPVFYIDLCAQRAMTGGLDGALLAAVTCLDQVFSNMSADVDTREVESTAINCLFTIASKSYLRQAVIPCFKAIEMMLLAARQELLTRGFSEVNILSNVLRNIEALVPLEAQMDKAGHRLIQVFPPYDLRFKANLPTLLAEVAGKIEPPKPECSWLDPFDDFTEASEIILDHYCKIAKEVTFDGALLEKWIVESIISSANVHLRLLSNPPVGSEPFLDTVDDRLQWYISAPSFFFRETTSFPWHHADKAAEGLAALGMKLLQLQRLKAAKACGEAVAAIADNCAAAEKTRVYHTATILMALEQLARAADALGYQSLAERFQHSIARPEGVPEEALPEYQEAMRTRIRQLDQALRRWDRELSPNDPVSLLRRILSTRRSSSPEA
jgi:hypothetical protein